MNFFIKERGPYYGSSYDFFIGHLKKSSRRTSCLLCLFGINYSFKNILYNYRIVTENCSIVTENCSIVTENCNILLVLNTPIISYK